MAEQETPWYDRLPSGTVWADISIRVALPVSAVPGEDPRITLEDALDRLKRQVLVGLVTEFDVPHWGGETITGHVR